MSSLRYALSRIAVHWLVAALAVFLLLTGTLVLAELPNTAQKLGNLRIHMLLGGIVALLVAVRLILARRHPAPAAALPARAGHVALNLLLLLLAFSGVMLAVQSGAFAAVFGGGVLPEDFRQFMPRKVHGLAARAMMGLVALHVLAALWHQVVLRDGLLARMGLGRGKA
ncbi:MAG: cytochrome b/b6 domain-containing protein [Proteobacteria bacterium]|jgi:cytochrome b561|nr:cytochrome b/b6 domain-containing protein [Pseudomonadota bacterium]